MESHCDGMVVYAVGMRRRAVREVVEVVEEVVGLGGASLGIGMPLGCSVVMLLEVDSMHKVFALLLLSPMFERRGWSREIHVPRQIIIALPYLFSNQQRGTRTCFSELELQS